MRFRLIVILLAAAWCGAASAQRVSVAVAASFTGAMQRLAPKFEKATGHRLTIIYGSTGKLYAQTVNGAPFDVFLSADAHYPLKLEKRGTTVEGSRVTYAIGRLVLWSPKLGVIDQRGDVLKNGTFSYLAIANPKVAPYGVAAEQTLRKLGAWDGVAQRMVYGESIAQTFQFISTGNAEIGFVSLSQIRTLVTGKNGSYWIVPAHLHEPLVHDAVLLKRGTDNAAARIFLEYLRSPDAQTVLRELGYAAPHNKKL
jgi:molybdate transport system substrate-binding protein